MKNILRAILSNIWIIVLDIFAVNVSYLMVLMIRMGKGSGYLAGTFHFYYDSFLKFAPFNTIIAIVVFALFRLYGGLWKYAGINDLNRVVCASLTASVLHILGITLFVRRMPMSYYVIGSIFQLLFLIIIRFSQRAVIVEKRLLSGQDTLSIPTLIVGAGELCRMTIKQLENGPFRPVVIWDKKYAGKTLEGVPITGGELSEIVNLKEIKEVMISDLSLSKKQKQQIKEFCEQYGIGCQDYTNAYVAGVNYSLKSILQIADGPVVLIIDGEEKTFKSSEEALANINDWYDIENAIDVKLSLKRHPSLLPQLPSIDFEEKYREKYGQDVSFF